MNWYLPADLSLDVGEIVGLSYMLFKFIDVLVNQWQGDLEPCDIGSYVNYQLAFFTLLAGPIPAATTTFSALLGRYGFWAGRHVWRNTAELEHRLLTFWPAEDGAQSLRSSKYTVLSEELWR